MDRSEEVLQSCSPPRGKAKNQKLKSDQIWFLLNNNFHRQQKKGTEEDKEDSYHTFILFCCARSTYIWHELNVLIKNKCDIVSVPLSKLSWIKSPAFLLLELWSQGRTSCDTSGNVDAGTRPT